MEVTDSQVLQAQYKANLLAITRGELKGYTMVHKFGKHEDVDTTYEPLSIGGIYNTPKSSGALAMRVKAGNADDTAAGDGAREITLQGLDETGALVTDTLATAGESAGAAGSVTFMRIFRAYVSKSGVYAGSGADSMAASVVIEKTGGTGDWLTIHKPDVGRGQSQIGQYTVPLGKTAYVLSYTLTTNSNKAVDFLFFKREGILDLAAPYQARRTVIEEVGIQGHMQGSFEGGQKFTELTDIGWMVKAAATAIATVDFEIILVDNN